MKFLKKSKVAAEESEDKLDVVIEINQKTSVEDGVIEAKVTEEEAPKEEEQNSPEPAAEDAPTQETFKEASSSVGGKFKFWKSAKEEKKEEEPVVEEAEEQEKEEEEAAAPAEETETEAKAEAAPSKFKFWKSAKEEKKEEPVAEPVAGESQEQEKEEEEEAAPAEEPEAEAEAAPAEEAEAEVKAEAEASKGEFCGTMSFLQAKFAFWQKKAVEEQRENEVEVEEKETQEKDFTQTVEVFLDGVAIQTIRLTNAGMDGLNNFIASAEGDAVMELPTSAPAPTPAPVEEEKAEVETHPAAKGGWWPFSSAKTEEKAVDEGRNETAEGEVDATEQAREVAATA